MRWEGRNLAVEVLFSREGLGALDQGGQKVYV